MLLLLPLPLNCYCICYGANTRLITGRGACGFYMQSKQYTAPNLEERQY